MSNELINILDNYSITEYNYNLKLLCRNPSITWDFIVKHKLHMNTELVKEISLNQIVTLEIISNNSYINWSYENLSLNKNINIIFVLKNLDKNWNWNYLSQTIKISEILQYPHLSWNWLYVSMNYTVDDYIININNLLPWNINGLCNNNKISLDTILKYCTQLKNDNLDINNLRNAARNIKLDIKTIEFFIEKGSFFYELSSNPNLTEELILKYKNKGWDYNSLSCHKNISWNFIIDNSDIHWNRDYVSRNPNVTLYIITGSNYKFTSNGLSLNPNITIAFIKEHTGIKWNFELISENTFNINL
jgi:hypothetical protein